MEFEQHLDQGKPPIFERRIHTGDVLTAFVMRVHDLSPNVFDPNAQRTPPVLDLSMAVPANDELQIQFTRPDNLDGTPNAPVLVSGTFVTVTPPLEGQVTPVSDGSDGYIEFTTVDPTFWGVAGLWQAQAIVTLPPGIFHSQIVTFRVHARLPTT